MQQFNLQTKKKFEIVDLTSKVIKIVEAAKVKEGQCTIFTPHATAAIIINENYDPSLCSDILDTLDKLVPESANYRHDAIDNNAQAHIKAALLGPSKTVPIKDRKLALGRWQGIALCEFDGPRERNILVQIT